MKLLSLDCESKCLNSIPKLFKSGITISMEWGAEMLVISRADLHVVSLCCIKRGRRGDNTLIADRWADRTWPLTDYIVCYLFISHLSF